MQYCKLDCDMTGPQWAFRMMTRSYHIAHDSVFDKLGLKDVGQPVMLFILNDMRRTGSVCTQKELADLMRLSPSTVTISIKSLERRGYVCRKADEADNRRNIVAITDEGAETAEICRRAFDSIDKAMYSGFTEDEKVLITGLFRRITENLQTLSGESEAHGK